MEGYFWGCALKVFSEKLINVTEFRCEKKRDWGQIRRFIKIAMSAFFLTEHGRPLESPFVFFTFTHEM